MGIADEPLHAEALLGLDPLDMRVLLDQVKSRVLGVGEPTRVGRFVLLAVRATWASERES